MKVKLLH